MPDGGIATADIPLVPGFLVAGGGGQAIPQQIQPYQAPSDLQKPLIPSPGNSPDATLSRNKPLSTASGPSGLAHEIATAQGPLTPELGRRSGIPAEYVPIINWIAKGEAKGYNELYNGQHFSDMSDHPSNLGWKGDYGPDGRHTSSAGLLQWQVGTFNEARSAYNASHPNDQVHDFSDVSQNKVGAFWIDKTYREKTGGRDIVQDLYAGKTDLVVPALKGQWSSLGKGQEGDQDRYGFSNPEWGRGLAEESRANTAAELATIEKDKAALIAAINKEAPGTAKRMQMLEEAHEASKRSTALYEKQMSTPPIYQPTDVFAGWGGVVMALAALAGRKSAQPLTAALNGMAGAMEGMNSGNREQYDRAFNVWEKQTDYGLKLVDIQNQEIRSILEDQRLSDAEKQANLMNTYRLFEMDREAAAARRGDLQLAWQHLDSSERLRMEGQRLQNDILRLKAEQDKESPTTQYLKSLNAEWQANHPGETMPESVRQENIRRAQSEAPSGAGGGIERRIHDDLVEAWLEKPENAGQDVPPEVDAAAWREARARGGPKSGVGLYMEAYKSEHPGATSTELLKATGDFKRVQSLDAAFAGGILGRQVVSLNTVSDHLLLTREYFEALNNGQIPRANQLANVIAVELGKPEVTNFRAGRDIMADEVVRLLTSTGGTEADRTGMQSRLADFFSPNQGKGVLMALDRFVNGRFKALGQQYAQGDPEREKYFRDNLLTDDSRKLRDRVAKSSPGSVSESAAGDGLSFKGIPFTRAPEGAIDVPDNLKNVPDGKVVGDPDNPRTPHYLKEGGKLILLVPKEQ